MNRLKTTPTSASKPQAQNRSSTSSLGNTTTNPKSADKLSKPTVSTFMNNNAQLDMVRKSSTGSTGARPNSGSSPRTAKSSQQTKLLPPRPTTPVQQNVKPSMTSPTTTTAGIITGSSTQAPQKTSPTPAASPQPQQKLPPNQATQSLTANPTPQQKLPNVATQPVNPQPPKQVLNPSPYPTKQTQEQPTPAPVQNQAKTGTTAPSATASTSSIKVNGNQQRPKSTVVSNSNNNGNNNNSISKQGQNQTNSVVFQRQSTRTFPVPVSQHRYPNNISRSMVSLERSRNFRAFIEKAMHDHKIFSCCGVYPAIRNSLKKRGWVEKPGPLAYSRSTNTTLSSNNNNKGPEDESDVAWMTRVLKDYPPDFIWVIRRDNIDWKSLTKDQLINRFPKAWFTTKVGLAACLQHMHWFSEAGVSDTFFPRCYRLCLEEERQAFQDDYRLTACMSYLRYFVDTFETKGHAALADVHSKITPLSVDFASRQLGNYIRMRRHEDIDWLLPPNFMTQHWDAFIHQYYAVVHERKRLRFDSPEAVHVKYETAKKMLHKVAQYWPQIELDGKYNMWICKPGARSRGKGIVIMNTLEKIMDLMSQNNFRECNWVVQKYIERPMLIYKTKFDMRQWFLITDWTPLTCWFYKESYVRFCTKPFILEDFHESIHLCNNAIQCRYQNSDQRDSNLPDENMWSSDTFQAYLKTIGRLDAWPLIYSGMKQAIVGVLLASQETVESRKGCYELYGADFMLTEDFRPWLIEINSCPCMAASTSVTARMCAQCLEDTVKVVVDRRNNRNAETGMFEMIYRQNAGSVAVQQFSGHDLTIIGKKLTRDIDWPMTMSKSVTSVHHPKKVSQPALPQNTASNNNNRQTLSELLQKLRVRNQEMFQGALASQQANMASIFEGASGNSDAAGSLLNKMRSLKSNGPQDDVINGMKKVYPTPDPKQGAAQKQATVTTASHVEKDAVATGKGEDPSSISSKFTDMNSLAYLMRNSQNVSKDAVVQDNKAKRQDDKRSSLATSVEEQSHAKPVPKTLAEVKAMVEATSRNQHHNSEKYGKIQSDTNNILISNNVHGFVVESDKYHKQETSIENSIAIESTFKNHSAKKPTNNSSSSDNERWVIGTAEPVTSSAEKCQELDGGKQEIEANNNNNNITDNNDECIEIIRGTKNLPFTSRHSIHSWVSSESCHYLKQLSSKHSFTSKRSESQSYMIYPIAAHPSDDHLPCESKITKSKHSETNQNQHTSEKTPKECECKTLEGELISLLEMDSKPIEDSRGQTEPARQVEEPPLIDLVSSDTTVQAQFQQAREIQSSSNIQPESEDPQGKLYQSILFTTSSSSDSDNDLNDDNNNEINLISHFTIPTIGFRARSTNVSVATTVTNDQNKRGESCTKTKTVRSTQRRNTVPSHRRCSRRFPCYRVILEPQNCQRLCSKKKTATTLPLKTVNLLLPPNCNNCF